jgi:hypothetical protein
MNDHKKLCILAGFSAKITGYETTSHSASEINDINASMHRYQPIDAPGPTLIALHSPYISALDRVLICGEMPHQTIFDMKQHK